MPISDNKQRKAGLLTIRGKVERIYHASPRFSAGLLRSGVGPATKFAGPFYARVGDSLLLHGGWSDHAKYGRQFQVEAMQYNLEFDTEGLANYLANHPDIMGIGPAKARIIADTFGHNFEDVLLGPGWARIARVAHVSSDKVEALREIWETNRLYNSASVWLAAFGLTHNQIVHLTKKLGDGVVGLIKDDPYMLVGLIPGFGFKRIDQVALKMGIPKENESRIRHGILYCVEESIGNGHCWVGYDELVERANRLLIMDGLDSRERITKSLQSLIAKGTLAEYPAEELLVARPDLLQKERYLAEIFRDGSLPNPHADLLQSVAVPMDSLTSSQTDAVNRALDHTISLVSGPAGTGKSYTITTIVDAYEAAGLTVELAAPTGKAAKRLEQVTGRPAQTIHRLLEYNGEEFNKDADDPIAADVVALDEVSMADVPLLYRLFQAINLSRTAVVLAGDHNQLPPVGPGNVLRDLFQTRVLPTTRLKDIIRQAGVLQKNCTAILQGEVAKTSERDPETGRRPWVVIDKFNEPADVRNFIIELFDKVIIDKLGYDPFRDVQVLTPTNKGELGTRELNIQLQRLLQKKLFGVNLVDLPQAKRRRLLKHDKVIQTRNNYKIEVMNGAIGRIVDIDQKGNLSLDFDGQPVEFEADSPDLANIKLAYSITTHRAQGSEYPCVIAIIHKSHAFQHHRNLFYTAVTRAKECAFIIGDSFGIKHCAELYLANKRNTFLPYLLREGAYDEIGDEIEQNRIREYQNQVHPPTSLDLRETS